MAKRSDWGVEVKNFPLRVIRLGCPQERWSCLEYELRQGSALAEAYARRAIAEFLEKEQVAPCALKTWAAKWVDPSQLDSGAHTKRDRDRVFWLFVTFCRTQPDFCGKVDKRFLEIIRDDREIDKTKYKYKMVDEISALRKAFNRVENVKPAAFFLADCMVQPRLLRFSQIMLNKINRISPVNGRVAFASPEFEEIFRDEPK